MDLNHRLILSVSDLPFAENGNAGCLLMVSVSTADGEPYGGLDKEDFHVHWVLDAEQDVPLQSLTVDEYKGQGALPKLPGVYAVQLLTKGSSWTGTNSNIVTFAIYVKHNHHHGQTLYKIIDPSIALP